MTREEAITNLNMISLEAVIEWLKDKDIIKLSSQEEMARKELKALSQEPTDRIEYGTDGNAYKLWISNGKEFEQEPCDDAISREAVIEHFRNALQEVYDRNDIIHELEYELPSVTQKSGKWIPFSEGLPKPFENCLITTTDGEVIYHYDDGHYSKYKAWMPLPEPYEPQESEDKE